MEFAPQTNYEMLISCLSTVRKPSTHAELEKLQMPGLKSMEAKKPRCVRDITLESEESNQS